MSPPDIPEEEPEREALHPNFKAPDEQAAAASAAAYERYNAPQPEPEPDPPPEPEAQPEPEPAPEPEPEAEPAPEPDSPRTGSIPPPGTVERESASTPEATARGGGLLGAIRRKLGR